MQYRKEEKGMLIVLKKGEKIAETLNLFFKEQNIRGGSINGIGALDWADLSVYDMQKREYKTKRIDGGGKLLELVSLTGTVSEPGIHAHAMLTKFDGEEMKCSGGHLTDKTKRIDGGGKLLELVSLTGTVSEPGIHAHAMLTKFDGEEMKCFGGHLTEGMVGATCEMFLIPLGKIERKEDAETGLKLMKL
ncbi:DNA-binding protein [Candidatus Micrarchaeota archaeon]|nr:DNA-binding protein [Candidatus Micrarchaeota archaeon]